MDKFKVWFNKNKNKIITFVCIVISIYCLVSFFSSNTIRKSKMEEVTYTEFLEMVKNKQVDTVYYSTSDEVMTFTLFNDETKEMSKKERESYKYKLEDYRKTLYPAYDEFRKDMLNADVNLKVSKDKSFISILTGIISLGLPILWIYLIFKLMTSQTKGIDKKTLLQTSNVRFSDVIGQDEILDDIKFITELIKNPSMGCEIGAKVPKGVLLTGEPGTGKTLIAKAIAGEAGVPFLYMNASQFKELFVGMGAKRVRELFKAARENAPCIIFIDEIDAVGGKRDTRGSTSEDDQTINALLTEMDGFSEREGIFVIAATNRPDKLDKALIRSGRFDRQIAVNPPKSWTVRRDLFEHYLNNLKLADDVDLENLSKQVVGFTGADIATVCNEAGIIALMNKKSCVDNACIEEAIDKKIFKGNRSKSEKYLKDKTITAYHEAGHAVMTYLCEQPIARASIISNTNGVGGFVMQTESDSAFTTDKELRNQVMIAYAGRASEEIKFSEVTTGAVSDLNQATNIIIAYIEKYGFDKDFGLLDMQVLQEQSLVERDSTVTRLSNMSKKIYAECIDLLRKNYNKVELLAQKLLEVETLSGSEIENLLK